MKENFFAVGLLSLIVGCTQKSKVDELPGHVYLDAALWSKHPTIPVCWENPSGNLQASWNTLREALEEQFNKRTPIRFSDFSPCVAESKGVRVLVKDEPDQSTPGDQSRPGAVYHGKIIDGKPKGLVMNFTFNHWRKEYCGKSDENRALCIRMYALHEFGHVLGLAHEHERADNQCPDFGKDFENTGLATASTLGTEYDPYSIMNYCTNREQTQYKATLSLSDVALLQRLYGDPKPLPNGVSELLSLAPTAPTEDLKALDSLIGSSQIVALAEGAHANDTFHLWNIRVARYLIEKKGFKSFVIELPWKHMERINKFIQGETIDPSEIEKALGTFGSRFMAEFIVWLRDFNAARDPSERVLFSGFDSQQVVTDLRELNEALDELTGVNSIKSDLMNCVGATGYVDDRDFIRKGGQEIVPEESKHKACLKGLDEANQVLSEKVPKQYQTKNLDLHLAGARSQQLMQAAFGRKDDVKAYEARDEAMFLVAQRLRERNPSLYGRSVMWMHVWHAMKKTDQGRGYPGPAKSVGQRLAEANSDNYTVIAALAYFVGTPQGFFKSPDIEKTYSIERKLMNLDREALLVNLKVDRLASEPLFPAAQWFSMYLHPIPDRTSRFVPGDNFDGIVFFRGSSASH